MMGDENQGMYGPVEKTDRISRLPDDIRELILGFLADYLMPFEQVFYHKSGNLVGQ